MLGSINILLCGSLSEVIERGQRGKKLIQKVSIQEKETEHIMRVING